MLGSHGQYPRTEPTVFPATPSIAALAAPGPAAGRHFLLAACVSLLVAGCGAGGDASPDQKSSARSSAGPTLTEDYRTLIVAYAAESGDVPPIDPMTFIPAPGAPAGVRPLSVRN